MPKSAEKYAQIKHHIQAKTVYVREQQVKGFFTGGSVIMELYFDQKRQFKDKTS